MKSTQTLYITIVPRDYVAIKRKHGPDIVLVDRRNPDNKVKIPAGQERDFIR